MIKVSLLGDSIRMIGYGLKVPELLGENFEVFQSNDNGRFAKYTYRTLFDMEKDMQGSRIVHWNNGLWDTCDLFDEGAFTPENEYIDYMCKIADILLKRHDKVIFATTTPVSPEHLRNNNSVAQRYNSLIVPILEEKGVIINDLYSTVASDIDKYICDDKIHLSQEGIDVCAKQVADLIREISKTLK